VIFANLQYLDISINKIKKLPQWISNIEEVYAVYNPLETPPVEIVKQGKAAVRKYFEDLETGEDRLFEAKMLIIGDGSVGKTCILNRLLFDTYEETHSTEGIDINQWTVETAQTSDFKVNIWDFGGQEIYHNTHQFFLTKRSLYIFVWIARVDAVYRMAFGFWLNTVKQLSGDSPIIVIQNKIDERKMELNEVDAKKAFPGIVAFHRVSAKTGEGFTELRQIIKTEIAKLPHVGNSVPRKWVELRKHLESLPKLTDSVNTIEFQRYREICLDYDITPDKIQVLGNYYHDLGVFLHFEDNAILNQIVFLKPEWATEAVYRVIDDRKVQDNLGVVQFSEFSRIWHDYPEIQYVQLIELMQRFELCFQIPSTQTYIIPELIKANPPEIINNWDYKSSMRFQFQYKFMPAGVITRLIVLAHHLIDSDLYWKDGCILRYNGSRALLMAEHYDSRINVWITGSGKENILSIIRSIIDYIHQNLKPAKADERIPCNCNYCLNLEANQEEPHYWNYKSIQMFIDRNVFEQMCPKAGSEGILEAVSISKLLGRNNDKQKPIPLFQSIVTAAQQLQTLEMALALGKTENNRNTFIANVLHNKGYNVADQTLRGISASGKQAGEIDILIKDAQNNDISIIEAFNLDSLKQKYIELHINKLLFNYNRAGLAENYILIYSDANHFIDLWSKYQQFINEMQLTDCQLTELSDISDSIPNIEIKAAKALHSRNNKQETVYHIFVNMNYK